jgi:hypothetical protein
MGELKGGIVIPEMSCHKAVLHGLSIQYPQYAESVSKILEYVSSLERVRDAANRHCKSRADYAITYRDTDADELLCSYAALVGLLNTFGMEKRK